MDAMQSALEDVKRFREQFSTAAAQMSSPDLAMQAIVDKTHHQSMMAELRRRAAAGSEEARGCGAMVDHVMRASVMDEAIGIIERRKPRAGDIVDLAMRSNGVPITPAVAPAEQPAPAGLDAISRQDTSPPAKRQDQPPLSAPTPHE